MKTARKRVGNAVESGWWVCLRSAAPVLFASVVAFCSLVGPARADAPAWKLLAVTGPTNLAPRQSEVQRVAVEAEGGSFRLERPTAEGEGTILSAAGSVRLTSGSNLATVLATSEGAFSAGQSITGAGIPPETTIVSVSGSVLTLSNPAAGSRISSASAYSKELTGVTISSGQFRPDDLIVGEHIPPGTTVVSVGPGTLTLSAYPTGKGTVTLRASERTAPIAYDASAQEVQAALEALPVFPPGSLRVEGGPGGAAEHPYFVEFEGAFAEQDVEELEGEPIGLAGEHAGVHVFTTVPGGPGTGEIALDAANVGALSTSGLYTMQLGPLPAGIVTSGRAGGTGWQCSGGAGESTVTCTSADSVSRIGPAEVLRVPIEVEANAPFTGSAQATISGGGAGSASYQLPIVVSDQPPPSGAAAFWAGAFNANGETEAQAGGHPYSAISYFMLPTVRSPSGKINPIGDSRDVIVDLPPGFAGNPLAMPRCLQSQLVEPLGGSPACSREMSVGVFEPSLTSFGETAKSFISPIYNDVPPWGYAAEFTTQIAFPLQNLLASVRSSEDYGVRITAPNNPNYNKIYGAFAALEGEPPGAHGQAFIRNPTDCADTAREAPVARTRFDTWQEPGLFSADATQVLPALTGCERLQFHPSFSFQPTTLAGSSPAGAVADLHVPQAELTDPNGLATPDLKKAVVTLPEGLVLNPSSADGLATCSEEQVGYIGSGFPAPNPMRFDESAPSCPDGSKLGTVEVSTPLLEGKLEGTIYLAAQENNPFHSLLALYLVVDDARTGVTLKLPGKVEPDPVTGQMTATFDNNPQLPFEDLTLHFRGGGPRSELATPEVCGKYKTTGALTPWSAPESGPPTQIEEAGFDVDGNCAGSLAARPFAPSFEVGTTGTKAGDYSPLVIKVNRKDGEQELTRLDFILPKGLTGKLAGVPYCPEAAIAAAEGKSGKEEQTSSSCPAASRLGSVDTAAGVGSEPFHVGGNVYLAGPYRGAPISTVVITPAVAGPFDLGNVVIRAPLYVDPDTAQLTVKSDPIPTILKGIPLKIRSVAINVDRSDFILNPTNCEPMSISASIAGGSGATATPSGRFQVGNCNDLKFSPKLKISLDGGTRRNSHPALIAKLTQPAGQANIGNVSVALPHSEFLDQAHIGTICTRVQFAAKECPNGSIYGRAEAITPLLDQPLKGFVYLRSSNHKLPDLVAALRGPDTQPIEIDLDGRIDAVHGGIRNTFEMVPDAAVSKFVLHMKGGKKGLLVNSTNICRGKHLATVRMGGQNGKAHNFRTPVKADCRGKKSKRRALRR